MRAIFRSRQRIANKATLTMEKQKRATIAVALSISSYSERQKPANFKDVKPMNKC
jgi:hypothetical protein